MALTHVHHITIGFDPLLNWGKHHITIESQLQGQHLLKGGAVSAEMNSQRDKFLLKAAFQEAKTNKPRGKILSSGVDASYALEVYTLHFIPCYA